MLSNRIYPKERHPQYKSDKNKRSARTPNCKKNRKYRKSEKHLQNNLFFEKSAAALIDLPTLRCQGDLRAALSRLNAIEYCLRFSKEHHGDYFCPT